MRPDDHGPLLHALALGQDYVQSAAVVFIITGYYERLAWKYGERAYRYMCMDVGFLGENLYLVSEGLGLGACAIAGFIDDAVEDLLDIDGRDELALLLVSVGVPRASH
jgi:SagB-type dehydrogenase family enzyme